MRKYLHLFKTTSEFENVYNGEGYKEPWVSYTKDSGTVKYNKTEQEKPLTFKITSDGDIKWKARNASSTREIQYSKNSGEWTTITSTTGGTSISVVAGDVVKFKSTAFPGRDSTFSGTTAGFSLEGNIMSLGGGDGFASLTEITQIFAFSDQFRSCTGLTDANKLVLPATTLTKNCYAGMFGGCTSLVTAPELPATTLAENCYDDMFGGCTSLVTSPELPATTLAENCYDDMFGGCTSLVTAPELPATTLADYCYTRMFEGCTSLTTAPALPATTLADNCYASMFIGCTSLTAAPELPATTLADYCYGSMFLSCISLTTAPALPATTLADYCYNNMFNGCTSLATAPALPATTLANYCYNGMFNACTSLTAAPELPATTLADNCYIYMFAGCRSLNYIKCLATDISASNCTANWAVDVASTGTFVKAASMSSWSTGVNGIPTNWAVQDA